MSDWGTQRDHRHKKRFLFPGRNQCFHRYNGISDSGQPLLLVVIGPLQQRCIINQLLAVAGSQNQERDMKA
jgi:hypothetical protein